MTTTVRTTGLRYSHRDMESKWQRRWSDDGIYRVDDDDERPKWYELHMYPYPSGDLHIGHWYAMSGADVRARYMRMQGYNVLHPMGFDAFGLNAENAAISRGIHPRTWTMDNIENMRRQLRMMGPMYDWDREVVTCTPDYYKWNQWMFLKLYEAGLAYRDYAPVNWCPSCNTVLANEQVIDGLCERCDSQVTHRDMNQWFFRITRYADELLDHSKIDWPEKINTMQTNWVGRSEGRRDRVRHLRIRAGAGGDRDLHHPHRHHLRGDLRRAGAGAPVGREADHGGASRRGRGLRGRGAPPD